MDLIDIARFFEMIFGFAGSHPFGVFPLVFQIPDDGCRLRTLLGVDSIWICLVKEFAFLGLDQVFVAHTFLRTFGFCTFAGCAFDDAGPAAALAERKQVIAAFFCIAFARGPVVPIAYDGYAFDKRCPHGKADAVLFFMGTKDMIGVVIVSLAKDI